MSTNSDDQQSLAPVGLDLVAPELYAPMLRRLALAASGIGLGAALLAATVVSWPIAAAIGVVGGGPAGGGAAARGGAGVGCWGRIITRR
ncbi:hypothetical protein ABZ507_32065, partial [Nocardia niwae]